MIETAVSGPLRMVPADVFGEEVCGVVGKDREEKQIGRAKFYRGS